MRKCAWIECQLEVYKPQNRRSIWCWEHLTEQVVNGAYHPPAEQIADSWIQEMHRRREAAKEKVILAYVPHWTVNDLCAVVLLCIGSVLSVVIGAWVVVELSKGVWWLILQFLRLIHLA